MKIPLCEELGRGHHSGGARKKVASLDESFLEARNWAERAIELFEVAVPR